MSDEFTVWADEMLRPAYPDDPGETASGALDFLRDLYEARGPVSRAEADAAWVERREQLTRAAVALIVRDIHRTTRLSDIKFKVWTEDETLIVSFNGAHQTPAVFAIRQPEVTCEVADYLRDFVVEELWEMWPVCKAHNVGLWPVVVDDRAVWRCRTDARAIAEIGELI